VEACCSNLHRVTLSLVAIDMMMKRLLEGPRKGLPGVCRGFSERRESNAMRCSTTGLLPWQTPFPLSRRDMCLLAVMTSIGAPPWASAALEDEDEVVSNPESRPLRVRSERAVAIRDDKDRVVANGVLWDDAGTVVSSYITFKDILRKRTPLVGEVGVAQDKKRGERAKSLSLSLSLGTLSVVGFDPTMDIVVFRSESGAGSDSLGRMTIVTGGYAVGQSVVSLVRDEQGTYLGSGIVSGLDRTLISANGVKNKGILQTDCPIGLASAGAGAWTEDGKLLGIIIPGNIPFASFRSDSGVNFILPSAALSKRVPELVR
jgi:hypothetical protein